MLSDEFVNQLAGKIAGIISEQLPQPAAKESDLEFAARKWAVNPMQIYRVPEAAEILGIKKTRSGRFDKLYSISRSKLKVTKIGGENGYLGIHILCYLAGRPPVDLAELLDAQLKIIKNFHKPAQVVQRGPGGKVMHVVS